MGRFDDQRLLEIYLYGRTAGVPADECAEIQRKLVILIATPTWTGIDLVGDPFVIKRGRIGMMITPDWGISFLWWEGDGAFNLRLEP
jgi:hypothetical protein